LATFTHDLEPTNLSPRNIIRGEDWIKATWNDCRRYSHKCSLTTTDWGNMMTTKMNGVPRKSCAAGSEPQSGTQRIQDQAASFDTKAL